MDKTSANSLQREVSRGAWGMSKLWEGQTLNDRAAHKAMDPSASWFSRHRRLVAMVAPGVVAYIIWWSFVIANPAILESFTEVTGKEETPNWYMCITMAFGSMLAGATSEGGASVAFPVMTLAFGILPGVARDFSFMIQSAGMTAAAATIAIMQVQVETHSIFYATIGGACGLALGLEQINPVLEPAYSKMIFVCTWAAFACSLFWLNRYHDRRVFDTIPAWDEGVLAEISVPLPAPVGDITLTLNWKACVLVLCGFVGGIFSSISGSGIDICTFSILTLLFRVSEKTATPTSVVLMAINTFVGYLYREFAMGGVERDAVTFFTVCVPIVVIGAPLGSLVGSHLHRLVLASFIYITDSVQFIGALIIVKPWTNETTDTPLELSIVSASILIVGSFLFAALAKSGAHLLESVEWLEKQSIVSVRRWSPERTSRRAKKMIPLTKALGLVYTKNMPLNNFLGPSSKLKVNYRVTRSGRAFCWNFGSTNDS